MLSSTVIGPREQLSVGLSGGRRAPACARATLQALDARLGEHRHVVRLLVSELVTNAVRHGRAGEGEVIEFKVLIASDRIRVDVIDRGAGFRPPETPQPRADGGYGLLLTTRLSSRWGVDEGHPTRVWFEIDRREEERRTRNQAMADAHAPGRRHAPRLVRL